MFIISFWCCVTRFPYFRLSSYEHSCLNRLSELCVGECAGQWLIIESGDECSITDIRGTLAWDKYLIVVAISAGSSWFEFLVFFSQGRLLLHDYSVLSAQLFTHSCEKKNGQCFSPSKASPVSCVCKIHRLSQLRC